MEVEVNPTILGRFLNILGNKFTFLTLLFLILSITSFFLMSDAFAFNRNLTEMLSPLGIGKQQDTADPLYEKVMKTKTLDNFPPNEFFPLNTTPKYQSAKLDIDARAFAAMDLDSRELLFAYNLTKRLPIASVTKVVTALVTLENIPMDALMKVSDSAASIGEATMGLSAGERVTVEELLYGAMLPSGNDAAETLAEGVGKYKRGNLLDTIDGGGGRKYFISEMNRYVQSLGMMDTYFFNPSGLDGDTRDKTSFSTVLDLLALGKYAVNNSSLANIVNTKYINLPYKDGYHKAFYLENILQLDGAYKGIKGIKPGNSGYAGETLLSYIERDGRRIVAVILGSQHTRDDVVNIYKSIFKS